MKAEGIESEHFWIGNNPLSGCIGCGSCRKTGHCVFTDSVNEFLKQAQSADGFIFGSPVHYAALDQMNKYFLHAQMLIIPSRYWNMVHGSTPEQVDEDKEGLQIMRTLGRNMSWFLNCKDIGIKNGVSFPIREDCISTSFIR